MCSVQRRHGSALPASPRPDRSWWPFRVKRIKCRYPRPMPTGRASRRRHAAGAELVRFVRLLKCGGRDSHTTHLMGGRSREAERIFAPLADPPLPDYSGAPINEAAWCYAPALRHPGSWPSGAPGARGSYPADSSAVPNHRAKGLHQIRTSSYLSRSVPSGIS